MKEDLGAARGSDGVVDDLAHLEKSTRGKVEPLPAAPPLAVSLGPEVHESARDLGSRAPSALPVEVNDASTQPAVGERGHCAFGIAPGR